MNMYQLNCFITVCRYMSFTKAASQLVITQQGISKIISHMEEELQVPLFHRHNSTLELTEYGALLLNSGIKILREYNSVTEQLAAIRAKNSASLTVYIPTGMMHVFPVDMFSAFRELHRHVFVVLQQAADTECENALVTGKADVAFCALPLDKEVFTVHVKKTYPVYFLVSKKNPLSKNKSITANQLKNERFITIDADNKSGGGFVDRCRKAGFAPNVYMRASDTQLIYKLCRENEGMSFYLGEPAEIPDGVAIIPEEPPNTWDVGLATLAYRKPSDEVEEFIRFFKHW